MGLFGFGKSDSTKGYTAAGKTIACAHCGGERFKKREAQLNTALMSAIDLDFLNESAIALVCENCGHIEWLVSEDCLELAGE